MKVFSLSPAADCNSRRRCERLAVVRVCNASESSTRRQTHGDAPGRAGRTTRSGRWRPLIKKGQILRCSIHHRRGGGFLRSSGRARGCQGVCRGVCREMQSILSVLSDTLRRPVRVARSRLCIDTRGRPMTYSLYRYKSCFRAGAPCSSPTGCSTFSGTQQRFTPRRLKDILRSLLLLSPS